MRPLDAADASAQSTSTFAAVDEQQTPGERPLAQARRLVLQLVQPRAPRR